MSAQSRPPLSDAVNFLSFLQRYRNDRGALANLRGSISETRRANAWPLLAGFKGADAIGNHAYETVAALWAGDADSHASDSMNLGATLAKLKSEHNSFELRFKRLLTCDRAEIPDRVATVVHAAQAKGMAVSYARLLSDLLCWGDDVKVSWAKSFWGAVDAENTINPDLLDAESAIVNTAMQGSTEVGA